MKFLSSLSTTILNHSTFILISLIVVGAFLRFYNLNWGSPYFFHPDERNIASSISQLRFPHELNPHFFAYGGLPIYLTFFVGLFYNFLLSFRGVPFEPIVSFDHAVMTLRIFSASLSVLCIFLVYVIGKEVKNKTVGIVASFLLTFSPGLIQYSHFGTFELWLTTFSLLLLLLLLKTLHKIHLKAVILLGVVFGALVAIKVSSVTMLPLTILPLILKRQPTFIKRVLYLSIIGITSGILWILFNPFGLLDYSAFQNSLRYESQVALGTLAVFYTGEFSTIIRGIFPIFHIYPFLLNPFILCLAIPAFVIISFLGIKKKNTPYLLVILFFLFTFLSQVPLFVQWTRYYVPTLPFVYLIISLFLYEGFQRSKSNVTWIKIPLGIVLIFISLLYCFAFIKTVYINPDSREQAAQFARSNLPPNARILSESYDLGIIPFNDFFNQIHLFNFYELDNNSPEYNEQTLKESLATSDYIVIPSQRLLKVRLTNAEKFPKGYAFYKDLTTDTSTYTRIYQTPCDFWCAITYGNNFVYAYEGTANIFDHPPVFIYKINHEQ